MEKNEVRSIPLQTFLQKLFWDCQSFLILHFCLLADNSGTVRLSDIRGLSCFSGKNFLLCRVMYGGRSFFKIEQEEKKKLVIFPTWNRSVLKTSVSKIWFNSLPGNYVNLGLPVIRSGWTASDSAWEWISVWSPARLRCRNSVAASAEGNTSAGAAVRMRNWAFC